MDSNRRKSSYSNGGGGNCVAVGGGNGAVYVEDTKQDHQAVQDRLTLSTEAWGRFLSTVK